MERGKTNTCVLIFLKERVPGFSRSRARGSREKAEWRDTLVPAILVPPHWGFKNVKRHNTR